MEERRQLKTIGVVTTEGRPCRVVCQRRFRCIEHELQITRYIAWPYRSLKQTRGDDLEPRCDLVIEDGEKVYFVEFDNNTESMKQIAAAWKPRYRNTEYVVLVVALSSKRRDEIIAATPFLNEFALYGVAEQIAADPFGQSYVNHSGAARCVAEAYC